MNYFPFLYSKNLPLFVVGVSVVLRTVTFFVVTTLFVAGIFFVVTTLFVAGTFFVVTTLIVVGGRGESVDVELSDPNPGTNALNMLFKNPQIISFKMHSALEHSFGVPGVVTTVESAVALSVACTVPGVEPVSATNSTV